MKNILRPIGTGIFFSAYFLYIASAVRPDLLYHALITDGGYVYPPFLMGLDFFSNALHYPGGIAWYLSSFLFQSYANLWLGALTVSVAAFGSFVLSRAIIRRFFGFPLDLFAYAPAMVALVVINRYGDPLPLLVNYNLSLVFTLMAISWLVQHSSRHWTVFPLCFGIVYYCIGGGAVLYTLLAVLYAFQNKRQGTLTMAAAIVSLAMAALLYRYCDLRAVLQYALVTGGYPERRLMADTKTFVDTPAIIASAFVVFYAILAPLMRSWHGLKSAKTVFNILSGVTGIGATFLIAAACLLITRDEGRRIKLTFEYLDRVGSPGDVVSLVDNLQPARLDHFALFDLNRALAHQGLLGEKMFNYPQYPDALTLENTSHKFWIPTLVRKAEFYFELGCLNLSKISLAELFEGSRIEHPDVIELLGKNALAHGRPAIAAMWYRRLSHDLIYGRKAKEVLRYLSDGTPFPGLDSLELVGKNAIKRDTVVTVLNLNSFCASLMAENPSNRMAFDYLVGNLLLSGNLLEAARYLPQFREAGYDRLPRNWAEALAIHCALNAITDSTLLSTVPPDVQASLMRFMVACRSIKQRCEQMGMSNEQYAHEAPTALREEFGSTYFFYYFFKMSGAARWYR